VEEEEEEGNVLLMLKMLSVRSFQISASFFVEILPVFHHTLQYSSK
jgi:hypothetical protein